MSVLASSVSGQYCFHNHEHSQGAMTSYFPDSQKCMFFYAISISVKAQNDCPVT